MGSLTFPFELNLNLIFLTFGLIGGMSALNAGVLNMLATRPPFTKYKSELISKAGREVTPA